MKSSRAPAIPRASTRRLASAFSGPVARARRAFTVAEVMVATFVMLFGISSALIVIQSGFRALDTARKTTLAAQIMQSEMERIRMLNWTQVGALPPSEGIDFDTIFPQSTEVEREVLAQIERTFTATRVVADLPAYDNEIREITVTITWRGIDGVAHTRVSSTQYCKNGLYAYYYCVP